MQLNNLAFQSIHSTDPNVKLTACAVKNGRELFCVKEDQRESGQPEANHRFTYPVDKLNCEAGVEVQTLIIGKKQIPSSTSKPRPPNLPMLFSPILKSLARLLTPSNNASNIWAQKLANGQDSERGMILLDSQTQTAPALIPLIHQNASGFLALLASHAQNGCPFQMAMQVLSSQHSVLMDPLVSYFCY